jgi:choice-of-anchor C domain-containing protein
MKKVLTLAIGLFLVLTCVATVSANLVSNGDFENPKITGNSNWLTYSGSDIPGWEISGNVDLGNAGMWDPSEGAQSIDLAGDVPARISQTIVTEKNGNYELKFWLAGNPGEDAWGVKGLNVYWNGEKIKSLEFDTTNKKTNYMGWTLVTIPNLIAKGTSTEIAFEQGATKDKRCGVALDGISVEDPITPAPEFPSAALPVAMLVGFIGIVLYVQNSRKD